jgi:ubiquitin carboxyl-terminal hydrolase 4/11/15
MFSLNYFSTPKEMIPTGWNSIDEDKAYPTLASRAPEPQMRDSSLDSYDDGRSGSTSDADDDSSRQNGFSGQTRMNEESSEEDEAASAPTVARVSFHIPLVLQPSIPFLVSRTLKYLSEGKEKRNLTGD